MKKSLFTFLLLCTSIVLYSCSQDSSVTVNQVRMNWWYEIGRASCRERVFTLV
jgi:hypothetical protein